MIKKTKKYILTIEFDTKKACEYFMEYLCEAGEQDYWKSMEYVEEKDTSDGITAIDFDYDFKKGKIKTVSGRLDK